MDWEEDRRNSSFWIYVCLGSKSEISPPNFSCCLFQWMCVLMWRDSDVLDSDTWRWSVSRRAQHHTCYKPGYKNTPFWHCRELLISLHVSMDCQSRREEWRAPSGHVSIQAGGRRFRAQWSSEVRVLCCVISKRNAWCNLNVMSDRHFTECLNCTKAAEIRPS